MTGRGSKVLRVLAINLGPRLRPAEEAPFLDWHTRLPYPSSLIRLWSSIDRIIVLGIIAMAVFHYTANDARSMRCSGRWRLSIGYCQCPDHNQSKATRADSRAKKFRMPDLPTLFDSEEDTLAMGAEFREHVENVVRGN